MAAPQVTHDPLVPGLSTALDVDQLFQLLTDRLPECRDGLQLLEGRAVDVQYTPGEGAQILWKVRAHDESTARSGRQLLSVRALGRDESVPSEPSDLIAKYRELRANKTMQGDMPFRTPWFVMDDVRLIVHAFPLDPALPSLMTISSPDAMRVALQRLWKTRDAKVRRVRVDTLSYTPGARAAMQYEVLAEDRVTSIPELRRLVGKLDVRKSPARLFAGHWAVWRKTYGQVSIAPPVGYVAVAQLSLQEFLTGQRLSDSAERGEFAGLVRQAARAVAKVHELNLPLLRYRSVDKEMRSVERWSDVLARIRPAQASRLEDLSRSLRQRLSDQMRITATIHADFHLANILADEHGVTLIDWDQVAHGDPMLDVGRFLASLRVTSLRLTGGIDGLAPVEEAFLESYLRESGDDEKRARLFEAASLLTAAAAPFRLQREGWDEYADLMIDEVARILDLSNGGSRVGTQRDEERRRIPYEDRLAWATDRVYAQSLLIPVVQRAYGADIELTECEPLVKDRSHSRLHLRWSLKGYLGDERWRRSVEGIGFPDTSGHSIYDRLRLAYFGSASDQSSIGLARPLGLLGPLSMVAFEPATGERLDKLLGTDAEDDALDRLAESLHRFQRLEIPLSRRKEPRRIVRPLVKLVRSFGRSHHSDSGRSRTLLRIVRLILEVRSVPLVPSVVPLSVKHIRLADRVYVSPVHDVILTDPLYSVASILTDLAQRAIEGKSGSSAAGRFRTAYLAASGENAAELEAWEGLMLLRAASNRAARDSSSPLIPLIIDSAENLLSGATVVAEAATVAGDSQ